MFNLDNFLGIARPAPVEPGACYRDLGINTAPGLLSLVGRVLEQNPGPETWLTEDSRTFWQYHLPADRLSGSDPVVDQLARDFTIPNVSLLYTQPWTSIKPHRDRDRLCGINAVLTPSPATSYWLTGQRRPDQQHIVELESTRFRYYAFNTAITHGVVNRSEPRLVLSINFAPPTRFEDIVNWFQTQMSV